MWVMRVAIVAELNSHKLLPWVMHFFLQCFDLRLYNKTTFIHIWTLYKSFSQSLKDFGSCDLLKQYLIEKEKNPTIQLFDIKSINSMCFMEQKYQKYFFKTKTYFFYFLIFVFEPQLLKNEIICNQHDL